MPPSSCVIYTNTAVAGMLLLLLLAVGGSCLPTDNTTASCDPDTLVSCAYTRSVEEKIRFAMSEEELEMNCPYLHESLRCIDNFTRVCLRPEQRSAFYRLWSGAGMVLQEICNPGHYRERFLIMAPCVNNVTDDYMACANRYEDALRRTTDYTQICGELHVYVKCSEDVVRVTCGEDAAAFTAGFLNRMTESLFTEHCPQQTEAAAPRSLASIALGFLASLATFIVS